MPRFTQYPDGGKSLTYTAAEINASQRRIVLFRRGRSWFARWLGPEEAMIRELFGTNELCTSSLSSTPASEVLQVIRHLNPDYSVTAIDCEVLEVDQVVLDAARALDLPVKP